MKYWSFKVFWVREEIRKYKEWLEAEYYSKNKCPHCELSYNMSKEEEK